MKRTVYIFITLVAIIMSHSPINIGLEHKPSPRPQMPPSKIFLSKATNITANRPDDEETGNTTNLGLALEDKDKIYYSAGSALWSINKNGTSAKKITDTKAINIQMAGNFIYYINEDTSEIYRVAKDGTQKKKISNDKAYSLNIYKDKIYFMDRYNSLYITSMSLQGKNKTVIKKVIANDLMVYNDYVYYVTGTGTFGKVKIDGTNHQVLKEDVMQFDVTSSAVYYTYDPRKAYKPRGLYKINLNGNKEEQLLNETPYSFNVMKDTIYYNHPTKMTLYSMGSNGTQKTQIVGNNTMEINIAGDYIFYKNLEDNKKMYRVKSDGKDRRGLSGETMVTNVVDLTKEIHQLDGKQIAPKLSRAYSEGKNIIAKIIKPHMTDDEKVKKVHDYIVNNTVYDTKAAEDFLAGENADANAFTAYGVLINKKGVCQGYAEAAQLLFSMAGIQSSLVIGSVIDDAGNEIPHMWNIVRIGGEYSMIDTTWDDPVGDRDILSYDYFMVDDETLKKTHTWNYDEYPPCT